MANAGCLAFGTWPAACFYNSPFVFLGVPFSVFFRVFPFPSGFSLFFFLEHKERAFRSALIPHPSITGPYAPPQPAEADPRPSQPHDAPEAPGAKPPLSAASAPVYWPCASTAGFRGAVTCPNRPPNDRRRSSQSCDLSYYGKTSTRLVTAFGLWGPFLWQSRSFSLPRVQKHTET